MRAIISKRKFPGKSVLDFAINSEPRSTLGRFFLRTDQLMIDAGFTPRVVDFDTLQKVNEANRIFWPPLIPAFNRSSHASGSGVIPIVCYNRDGEAAAVTASRRYDMTGTNFLAEANSLRLYFGDHAAEARKTNFFEVTANGVAQATGIVSFLGAGWVRPDCRGSGVFRLLPKLARYFSYGQVRYDFDVAFSIWNEGTTKFGEAHTYEYVESGFTHRVAGLRDDSGVVGWISENHLLRSLERDVFVCEQSRSLDEVGSRKKELLTTTGIRH